METFYFGRLNYNNKKQTDLKSLLKGNSFYRPKKSNYKYGIFCVEEINDDDLGKIYTGELVKIQDLKEEEVVKEHEITNEYIPDVISGKSRFYLLEKSHIIAYNPYGKIISPKAFCQTFVGVLMLSDDSLKIDAEIYPINDEYEFVNFLKKMTTISNIALNLTPSNPENRDIWKVTDDRLNSMNAGSYSEKIKAKPNQSLIIDELTESKIAMAEDGYGKVVAKGTDENGDSVEISTERKESVIKKEIFKDLMQSDQLKALKKVFMKILDRFKK
ncbi:DUF4747 family protein [Kordia zhangzhouensis]|uniref:DUF4747 family protein n=1 Tax=Kordia zhangzhouensis TaxID=1620405 RepID=UPI000629924F|nr:DUF4747 family protein [Kordia zhangzhouensis]